MMTEEEFIKKYCIWCDIEDYTEAQWGKIAMLMKDVSRAGVSKIKQLIITPKYKSG